MPCGKRPLTKNWDKPRNIRVITPSRYEQNEASVKVHWKNVLRALELSYKDEKFWDSHCDIVRDLVGPIIFRRIAKIFSLPAKEKLYEPKPDMWSAEPSEEFYEITRGGHSRDGSRELPAFSASNFDPTVYDEEMEEGEFAEEQSVWSVSSTLLSEIKKVSRSKSIMRAKSMSVAKTVSKNMLKQLSKSQTRSYSRHSRCFRSELSLSDELTSTLDDLEVHLSAGNKKHYRKNVGFVQNPHFDMLYCNKSETDMIKWNSKYKQKAFEVSASDEFSKKAEIMTKKIAKEFYDWWVGLGNVEFKSEIKRPEDIEDLFQVWFDEHASRGLVLDHKILPCVLQSIANYVGVKKAACPKVLKRQIAYDIHAEISPAHTMAFGSCLPQKMKHIPPKNNTKDMWGAVKIPEDLRSMACVWDDVQHLTSTKAFHKYLQQRPFLPIPPILKSLDNLGDKKAPFVVPSDYVMKEKSSTSSGQDLALPVSEFSLELKEVLSKLLNG